MNAEEIRDEAIDRLARFRYEQDVPGEWDTMPEEIRARARRWAAPYVDALGDMLPTGADYRWVYEPDGTPLGYRERQLLTDWQQVTE